MQYKNSLKEYEHTLTVKEIIYLGWSLAKLDNKAYFYEQKKGLHFTVNKMLFI